MIYKAYNFPEYVYSYEAGAYRPFFVTGKKAPVTIRQPGKFMVFVHKIFVIIVYDCWY